MRVLLDATALPAQRTGVGHYVLGLAGALARRGVVELHVMAKARDAEEVAAAAPGAVVHPASAHTRPSRILWEQTILPVRVRRLAPAVFHGPHYTLPPSLRCATVVTFHDPTFFTHPHLHERAKVAYFTRMARQGCRRAGRVIAVSEYARRGAIEYAGADPERVDVVPLGYDPSRYRPQGDEGRDARLRARVGVGGPYLLWVGALEPRKDVPTLLEAFARLVREGAPHRLVLAGPRAWGARAVDEAIERLGLAPRVLRPGYVSEEEKVALLRGADALVYPSIAEGFGLQVLEAMACGCPVVTTRGSAPEEVGGEAVALVDPGDAEGLAGVLAGLLEDAGRREELRQRGLRRAASFSWDRTAEGTEAVYRRAAGGG